MDSISAPGTGEKLARQGYGYQDKAAAERILTALRNERTRGGPRLVRVKLADELAGRVDDCVLIWPDRVEGNSIKWSKDQAPLNWGALLGESGLLRELADGFHKLRRNYPRRRVGVRLQTRYPAEDAESGRLVPRISVAEFLQQHWAAGADAADTDEVRQAWSVVEDHTGLSGEALNEFVKACELCLGVPEPPIIESDDLESRHYRQQLDALQEKLSTWHSRHPDADFVSREFLLEAIGLPPYETALTQSFPSPPIPYEQNQTAAEELQRLLRSRDRGYVAVTGTAGAGKSTLVQDVLIGQEDVVFVPYFAYLPSGEGDPKDRGEALSFFQSVVARLDRIFTGRSSIGIGSVEHGRFALRQHMEYARERFAESGRKTVLLVDGLDHVTREIGLRDSLLHHLPHPDQLPPGFQIVLSARSEALLASAIGSAISNAVNASENQILVEGLSREEVHQIAARERTDASDADREALYRESRGNPLVLTYLFNIVESAPTNGFAEAIQDTASFEGDIDAFYADALGEPLEDAETRQLLALLCRAAPAIPTDWLQGWPESKDVENLYQALLAPFVQEEAGNLSFIHNSLVSFLIERTRSPLPGSDHGTEERAFYSALAERSANRECSDALGREHLFHLSRAGRLPEVLEAAKSSWFRMSVREFVPYAVVRPVVLEAVRVAWELREWGHVVRLVLLDAELAQRSGQLEPEELCHELLKLEKHDLALAQIQSNGKLLVERLAALGMARKLWFYADRREDQRLREASGRLYQDAKPIGHLIFGEPLKTHPYDDDAWNLIEAWSFAAPLFDAVEEVVRQVRALRISTSDKEGFDASAARAGLLYRSLRTVTRAELGADSEACLLQAIEETKQAECVLAAKLLCAIHGETTLPVSSLMEAFESCDGESDLGLELAEYLHANGNNDEARMIVEAMDIVRFEPHSHGPFLGRRSIQHAVSQSFLRERLGLGQADGRTIENGRDEAMARIERAAQTLGLLLSHAGSEKPPGRFRDRIRDVLFYIARPIARNDYAERHSYFVDGSRHAVLAELLDVAKALGRPGLQALCDVVVDAATSPSRILQTQCREFALAFREARVLGMDDAAELALSFTGDTEDDDPVGRQKACLDVAYYLRRLGANNWREWFQRAGRVSAGTGSHKDYRMAHLSDWLDHALTNGPMTAREAAVIEKFMRVLQVAGGAGQTQAARTVLRIVLRKMPSNARALAVEMIDRGLIGVPTALDALVVGAKEAGVKVELSVAIFGELLSLVAYDAPSRAAVSILDAVPDNQCAALATLLMERVRTNCLPRERVEVARSLLDVLATRGIEELDLAVGLPAGEHEDSRQDSLYKLGDGRTLTVGQMAARLKSAPSQDEWDPNPAENDGFRWWRAVCEAGDLELERLEAVLARYSPPEYRRVEMLAAKAKALQASGYLDDAREAAQSAIEAARDGSWFLWHDGAQRRRGCEARRVLEPEEAITQAQREFGENLANGTLYHYLLESELVGLFEFLELPWPQDEVLEAIEEYLDEVEEATETVDRYTALDVNDTNMSPDEALCRFLITLFAAPAIDIASGARRAFAFYLAQSRCPFIGNLVADNCWSDTELEGILIAVDVAFRETRKIVDDSLKPHVEALNQHESLAVRSVARQICERAGWHWHEVRDQPAKIRVVTGSHFGEWPQDGSDMVVGGDAVAAWNLWKRELGLLEMEGVSKDYLVSEFETRYLRLSDFHRWTDQHRRGSWAASSRGSFALRPRALVGREAVMRLFGRYALEGVGPEWAERGYNLFIPLYDPALEMLVPVERPSELSALNWKFMDESEKAWKEGEGGDEWNSYPEHVGSLRLIGEVSHFVRPTMEMFCETRTRGVFAGDPDDGDFLAFGYDWIHQDYRLGKPAKAAGQIVGHNAKGLLGAGIYQWTALNAQVARQLRWRPSDTDPFGWVGENGETKVRSVYWRDGRIGVRNIRSGNLGEGWCLLASDAAIAEIRSLIPDAAVHLLVTRKFAGMEPTEHSWHLTKPL